MSKNVLIISSSPRKAGNSDLLCDEFLKGATESGNKVEKIFLREKKIAPCTACDHCVKEIGVCSQKDDMAELLDKMLAADIIVLATPVYFYSVAAQMKIVIDRTVAKYTSIKDKQFYVIMTAAEDSKKIMERTLECFRGFFDCLPGAVERGVVYGVNAWKKGEIKTTLAMKEAYALGKAV